MLPIQLVVFETADTYKGVYCICWRYQRLSRKLKAVLFEQMEHEKYVQLSKCSPWPSSSVMDHGLYCSEYWYLGCTNLSLKAKRLPNPIIAASYDTECIAPQFSDGWVHRFKKRHGLEKVVLYKGSASTLEILLVEGISQLREQPVSHDPEDVFTADGSRLQYRIAPECTIKKTQICGTKEKMTSFACRNGIWADVLLY